MKRKETPKIQNTRKCYGKVCHWIFIWFFLHASWALCGGNKTWTESFLCAFCLGIIRLPSWISLFTFSHNCSIKKTMLSAFSSLSLSVSSLLVSPRSIRIYFRPFPNYSQCYNAYLLVHYKNKFLFSTYFFCILPSSSL